MHSQEKILFAVIVVFCALAVGVSVGAFAREDNDSSKLLPATSLQSHFDRGRQSRSRSTPERALSETLQRRHDSGVSRLIANEPGEHVHDTKSGGTPGYHRSFKNAHHWVKVFDDPARDTWQKPDQVVSALKLQATDKVADIGAGTGYFSGRIARSIPQGKVYAVDIESDMVKHLKKMAKAEKLPNLIPLLAPPDDPKLPEQVDLVLVVDTFHHIDARVQYFSKLKRYLSPRSRLAVIDFNATSKIGPPLKHRLSKESVTEQLNNAGFALEESLDFLPNQYFLVFRNGN